MRLIKGLLEAFLYFVIVILAQRIVYYLYSFIVFQSGQQHNKWIEQEKALQIISHTQTIPILIGWVISIGLIGMVFFLAKQRFLGELNQPLGSVNFLLTIVIGLGLVLVTNGIVSNFSEVPLVEQQESFFWTLVVIGIIIPIFEELVFRGFILSKLSEMGSKGFAIIFQALLFSVSHFSFVQGASVFLLGILAGYAVLKTRSIKSGIVIHCVFNITNLYLYETNHQFYDFGQLLIFIVLGLVMTYFGMEKLRRLQ